MRIVRGGEELEGVFTGSVVTKDIPANVVAVSNPCRVVRPVTEKDREVWDTGENGEGPLSQGPKANSPG